MMLADQTDTQCGSFSSSSHWFRCSDALTESSDSTELHKNTSLTVTSCSPVEDECPKWKLLVNVNYGTKKLLYVKPSPFLVELKHELCLLCERTHSLYAEGKRSALCLSESRSLLKPLLVGVSDKAWIIGPDDEIAESYSVVNGFLMMDTKAE